MMSCSVYKLRELARGQQSLLWDGMGVVHRVVSNCICASLVLYMPIIVIFIIITSFAFLLNCLYLNSRVFTFPILFPIPRGGKGRSEKAASWG